MLRNDVMLRINGVVLKDKRMCHLPLFKKIFFPSKPIEFYRKLCYNAKLLEKNGSGEPCTK